MGSGVFYAEELPRAPTSMEEEAKCYTLADLLSKSGITKRRLTTHKKVVSRKFTLFPDLSSLEYTPTKKKQRQTLLLADLYSVSKEDSKPLYNSAKLDVDKDVILSLRTLGGKLWRIILDSPEEATEWYDMIGYLLTTGAEVQANSEEGRLKAMWERADKNHDGALSLSEIKSLMILLNVEMEPFSLKKIFKKFDSDDNGELDFKEFKDLFHYLTYRPELKPIYDGYALSDKESGLTLGEFTAFLKSQGDSTEYAEKLFKKHGATQSGYLSFRSFVSYLFKTTANSFLKADHLSSVVDNMKHPLKDYFINSSHNTYLSGDQLKSKSKTEMYKLALLSGCRCVELDCWDGPNGDPIIYHGYTKTSKISFKDTIETIKKYAFERSPYPVILSLEVHTSSAQTDTMASHLKAILGPMMLVTKDLATVEYTPHDLKKKILVKWKLVGQEYDGAKENDSQDGSHPPPHNTNSVELSECVTVAAFKTTDWGNDAKPYYVQSYSENKINSFAASHRDNYTMQNSRMLSRVYPKGTRFSSNNYNPTLAWSMGAQLVALNFQTWDSPLRINDGFFTLNKRCGYVLKPAFLRNPTDSHKPTRYRLNIFVLGATQVPKPSLGKKGDIVDPYIVFGINGTVKAKTKVVSNNGLTPVWNEEIEITGDCFELDVLSMLIMDKDSTSTDDEVCEADIPVHAIREGFRAAPMKLCNGGRALRGTSLLCRYSVVKL